MTEDKDVRTNYFSFRFLFISDHFHIWMNSRASHVTSIYIIVELVFIFLLQRSRRLVNITHNYVVHIGCKNTYDEMYSLTCFTFFLFRSTVTFSRRHILMHKVFQFSDKILPPPPSKKNKNKEPVVRRLQYKEHGSDHLFMYYFLFNDLFNYLFLYSDLHENLGTSESYIFVKNRPLPFEFRNS